MYLSDTELEAAIADGSLIVKPPSKIGPSSVDLHLDKVEEAKIWNMPAISAENSAMGNPARELRIARMDYVRISNRYLIPPPNASDAPNEPVVRRDDSIIVRPGGFLLWQTREVVGTPPENAQFICFIDGKSTRARTGLVIHLTAPTIHAGWNGTVTLEIANFGPLDLVLHEGDAVAQIVVARVTSPPAHSHKEVGSATIGQTTVTGAANPALSN